MPVILMVEDNAILAAMLVRFLSSQGNLSVAAIALSAEAALEELSHKVVDLVLIDVALPGMNGIELVTLLRQQYPDLKCLMLSGHAGADYVGLALAAGANGYVIKGDPYAILDAVNDVLDGKAYLSKELQGKVLH
jgi:DNA-binding NarL/FixJ family response regulator